MSVTAARPLHLALDRFSRCTSASAPSTDSRVTFEMGACRTQLSLAGVSGTCERVTVFNLRGKQLTTSSEIRGFFLAYAFRCHADHFGSVLINRPRDSQPFHFGEQRGSFQSEFDRCSVRSAHDPASLLKRFQDQSRI
jgi:hypothetical protein